MVIQHNIASINSYRNQSSNVTNLNKNLEKLSSGYRINRAGDDAAGLAISEQMRHQINATDQAIVNAKDAVGFIQTAEGALTEVHSMLQRMTTLVEEGQNGIQNKTSKEAIEKELQQLKSEISRIATSSTFNDVNVFSNATFQVGPTSTETIQLSKVSLTTIAAGVSKLGASKLDSLKSMINSLSVSRADLGAKQNRLEHTISNLEAASENLTAAESRIRDTDMAKEISAFTKNNILNQAAQSMLAQANSQPQNVLSLLQ